MQQAQRIVYLFFLPSCEVLAQDVEKLVLQKAAQPPDLSLDGNSHKFETPQCAPEKNVSGIEVLPSEKQFQDLCWGPTLIQLLEGKNQGLSEFKVPLSAIRVGPAGLQGDLGTPALGRGCEKALQTLGEGLTIVLGDCLTNGLYGESLWFFCHDELLTEVTRTDIPNEVRR
jgi:hypothetical protein